MSALREPAERGHRSVLSNLPGAGQSGAVTGGGGVTARCGVMPTRDRRCSAPPPDVGSASGPEERPAQGEHTESTHGLHVNHGLHFLPTFNGNEIILLNSLLGSV